MRDDLGMYDHHMNDHHMNDHGLSALVGEQTYRCGAEYFCAGSVHDVFHATTSWEIAGRVLGSSRADYATLVSYTLDDSGQLDHFEGRCGCPVKIDCKHAVALLLSAFAATELQLLPADGPGPAPWERSLDRMVDLTVERAGAAQPLGLAFELLPRYEPVAVGSRARSASLGELRIRPVRRGRRESWVGAGVTWADLTNDSVMQEFGPDHIRLLRAVAAADPRFEAWQHGPRNPWMSLQSVRSPLIWDALADASDGGVAMIVADKAQSPVRIETDGARFDLDLTRTQFGDLTMRPSLTLGGSSDHENALFLGDPLHGVATWHQAVGSILALTVAGFTHRLDPESPSIFATGPVHIPAVDEQRFVQVYLPALRRRHRLVTPADGFRILERHPLILKLTVEPLPDHRLELDWHWEYRLGQQSTELTLRPNPTDRIHRDSSEEDRVLKLVTEAAFGLDQVLLSTPAGPALRASALTNGRQTLELVSALLPALRELSEVEIDCSTELPDYHAAVGPPAIGLSSVPSAGSTDWFDLTVTVTVDGRNVPFDRLFYALATDQEVMILDDGTYFSLLLPELLQLKTLIEEARELSDKPGSLRISRFQVDLWEELEAIGVPDAQSRAWLDQVLAWRDPDDQPAPRLPVGLTATLRDYQIDGFAWLDLLRRNELGGILADDMGLGKTIQTLAMIAAARSESTAAGPYLVIAPTSVLGNWQSEAARFTPGLRTVIISATMARRGIALAAAVAGADIVITSYTLLRLEAAAYEKIPFSGLIMDEAQAVKNHQSKAFGAIKRLPIPFKLAITGTPMENNLMELWALFSLVAPGLFPHPGRFNDFYRTPIEKTGDTELLRRLRRRIKPLMLRRNKEQVAADLPAKQEQVLEVDLEPAHRRVYQQYLQRERQKILGLIEDMDGNRFAILKSLMVLRQASIDPALVDDEHQEIDSTKMKVLLELLHDIISGGHRTLVFSQFTSFLHRVRNRLDAEGIEYVYLDGSTRNRPQVLQEFKSGVAPVFLISLKAGGVGLNLTEADYCILLDPWWNPATEAQAVDRVHRIGQQKNVIVYRLVSKDTIEEKVMALKAVKAKLFASVMSEDAVGGKTITAQDIRELVA